MVGTSVLTLNLSLPHSNSFNFKRLEIPVCAWSNLAALLTLVGMLHHRVVGAQQIETGAAGPAESEIAYALTRSLKEYLCKPYTFITCTDIFKVPKGQ